MFQVVEEVNLRLGEKKLKVAEGSMKKEEGVEALEEKHGLREVTIILLKVKNNRSFF